MSQRDDLLTAARQLLVEKGYARTTARDLATASGAHLASIGYHFGSKDALMTEATLQAQGEWGSMIDEAIAAANTANPADRLRVCIDTLVATFTQHREVLVASVQTYTQSAFDDEIRRVLAEATAGARTDFAGLALGVPRETVDEATANSLGSLVHTIIVGLTLQALVDQDSLPTGRQLTDALSTLTASG